MISTLNCLSLRNNEIKPILDSLLSSLSPWCCGESQVKVSEELFQHDGSAHQSSPAHRTVSQLGLAVAADQVAVLALEHRSAGAELVVTNLKQEIWSFFRIFP